MISAVLNDFKFTALIIYGDDPKMIDFHSHFLPGIDDGSKSSEMSLEMLKASADYGVKTMVATPHFYIYKNSADRFWEKRADSYEHLKKRMQGMEDELPSIVLGAEVYYFRGISHYDGLDKLKIGDTNYMLLEMPFEKWTEKILDEVWELKKEVGITPVIAHIDRYLDFQKGTDNIERLFGMEIPIQMNAEFINGFFTRGKAIKLIKDGYVGLLGSDCHNMDKRKPNLGQSLQIIEKKCGKKTVEDIYRYSKELLGPE